MVTEKKTLEDFEGFNEIDSEKMDFFGEEGSAAAAEEVVVKKPGTEEVIKDEEKEKIEEKETTVDEEEVLSEEDKKIKENLLFDDENSEVIAKKKKIEEAASVEDSISTVNFLKEKGLIEYELEDGTELTPELAEEILEDDFDGRVETRIQELMEGFPDILKQLNKYVVDGGNVNQFLGQVLSTSASGINETIDLENEANQELVSRTILADEGYDKEYIDTHIGMLKEAGKLKQTSEIHFNKWKKVKDADNEKLAIEQANRVKNEKVRRRDLKLKVKTFLEEEKDIKGFKINKKDKTILPSYMTDHTVTLKGGKTTTQMHSDLMEALADENKAILIAKILKSDFDFKSFAINAETKVAKDVKENITRSKKKPHTSAGGGSQKNKSLADYF